MSLGNLTKVTDIRLQYNNFTGYIPSSLSHLKDLNLVDLSYNKFEGTTLGFFYQPHKTCQSLLIL